MLQKIEWLLVAEAAYILVVIAVCARIVFDTRSVSKTLGYLLLVIFLPVFGILFYFSFGINYRKRKIYSKKLKVDEKIKNEFQGRMEAYQQQLTSSGLPSVSANLPMIRLLSNTGVGGSLLLENEQVVPLQNGESFFPILLEEMQKARKHIHIEFYIYEDDEIGNALKDMMIRKAKEGVEVRFIYDDFGSLRIRRGFVRELRANGVEAHPFNRIRIIGLANRLNYRNHRKIVVIDGETSFVGGINVSDRYINNGKYPLYWRDTHLMIKGRSSLTLQQVFLADWNFCSGNAIGINSHYFPVEEGARKSGKMVQIVSSGPDSDLPSILYSVMQAINKAEKEILITTPYYIPDVSLQEALIIATLSGVAVKLLVPDVGDSSLVNIASQSFFEELLDAGAKIYRYQKGFVHAKTLVVDRKVASVGTANMDSRSFDLNFEVSAIVYDEEVASRLADDFMKDLENAVEIDPDAWNERPNWKVWLERVVRLFSPFM